MNKAGTDRQPDYAITNMRGGGFRAECHVPGCGFWHDNTLYDHAVIVLQAHVVAHHPDVDWQPRRAEVNTARPRRTR
jgi:hypothetical protein